MNEESKPVVVPTVVDEPMDFTVIATSPKDMEAGQRSLILWAARKIQSIKAEIAEATEQLVLHQQKKWNTAGWRNQITKHERRAEFYRKVKMALENGYYIVPPFPIDLFTIRVNRKNPVSSGECNYPGHQEQTAQILPAGEGRYVSVDPVETRRTVTNEKGKEVDLYRPDRFSVPDFPFKLARAEIREATDNAMKLKIFDQLGVLPARRKADPVVCGQILVPNKPNWGPHGTRESITFFIAWWIDTRTL